MWTYHQASGELFNADGERIGVGYAGYGEGRNNPALHGVEDVGPIPRGKYWIGPAYEHPKLGPVTMNLMPELGTNTQHGRGDFRIHGDKATAPGTASHGCIVQAHDVRVAVNASDDKMLEVM